MIELYKVTVININVTDVHIQPSETPTSYLATQNYPNPFNGPTIIEYRLPETSEVELVVYDLHGREVVTLLHGLQEAGRHRINWDGTGHGGVQVSSGIYFYRITAYSSQLPSQLFSVTKRMIYLK